MEFIRHHRSINSIHNQVQILRSKGFNIPQCDCYWSKEAAIILKEDYPKFGRNSERLLMLGYSKAEIDQKARREGIKFKDAMQWTNWLPEEDLWLKDNYETGKKIADLTLQFIETFPTTTHTEKAIRARLKTLRLSCIENVRFWTVEEDEIVKANYPTIGTNCVDLLVDRTRDQVRARAKILKVRTSGPKNAKKIRCVETGEVFNSSRAAATWATGKACKDSGSIGQALKTGVGIAYGYHWEYTD